MDTGVMAASILILLEEMDTWGNGCFQELNKKNPGRNLTLGVMVASRFF